MYKTTPLTELERKHYVQIAKDFCYSDEIVNKIREAKTEEEVERILTSKRIEKKP